MLFRTNNERPKVPWQQAKVEVQHDMSQDTASHHEMPVVSEFVNIYDPEKDMREDTALLEEMANIGHMSGELRGKMYHALEATLRLNTDLSKLHERHYETFNSSATADDLCERAFDRFVEQFGLGAELTAEEEAMYENRVCTDLGRADFAKMTADTWNQLLRKVFEDQKPAVTEKDVDAINKGGLGMRTKIYEWMKGLSKADMDGRNGFQMEDEAPSLDEDASLLELNGTGMTPASWEGRDAHSACTDIYNRVRNQANCGSCWAFGAAAFLDIRMCVSGSGRFNAGHFNSAGYISWCYNGGRDGCAGGDPRSATAKAAQSGNPSGLAAAGCIPYDMSGSASNHMGGSRRRGGAQCPTTCQRRHPRALEADKFFAKGIENPRYVRIGSASLAQQAKDKIYAGGVVGLVMFAGGRGWNGYRSGTYAPGCNARANHAVTGIGFTSSTFTVLNSYGSDWGMRGTFIMDHCTPTMFFWSGDMSADAVIPTPVRPGSNSPGPSPSTPTPTPPRRRRSTPSPTPPRGSRGDTCRYAHDGACDEPKYCSYGTDCTDCHNCDGGSESCEDQSNTRITLNGALASCFQLRAYCSKYSFVRDVCCATCGQ